MLASEGHHKSVLIALRPGSFIPRLTSPPSQAENINSLVQAAGIEVEPYWPSLFAKLAQKKSVDDFIMNVGAGECR